MKTFWGNFAKTGNPNVEGTTVVAVLRASIRSCTLHAVAVSVSVSVCAL